MFTKKVKVTRSAGDAVNVVRRDDIGCGVSDCSVCEARAHDYRPVLSLSAPILVPDAATLVSYVDIFDDPCIQNVVLLSTVMLDVNSMNRSAAVRLSRLATDPRRRFFAFPNDRHQATEVQKGAFETDDDFAFRKHRAALMWLSNHGSSNGATFLGIAADNKQRSSENGITFAPLREALSTVLGSDHQLLDRIAELGARTAPTSNSQFESYWPDDRVSSALSTSELIRGKFRASEGSCFFGEIRGAFGVAGERVLLPGRGATNRALHDDVVAVLVDPVEKWRPPTKGAAAAAAGGDAKSAVSAGYVPTGRVVAILEKCRRPYCGSIDVDDAKATTGLSGSVSVLFRPKSSRIPRIRISTHQVDQLKTKRLRVVVDEWPVNSAFPFGHYTDVIGEIGDRDTEAHVILLENDIPHYDFSEAVYDCLPKGTWEVETSEVARRRDLRGICICSVDPLGCRDIDDALHWRTLPNGNIEVGVHIADVSHFVLDSTPLDEEAAKRCTSVYLVDRRINMLPQLLTENLCSIVGGEDRYAFSVLWEFKNDAEMTLVSEWFGKTIICSHAALYYGDAQKMIDDTNDLSELAISLRGLMQLSRILKHRRDDAGALTLGSQEFKFKIDNDHVNPTDMIQYQTFETNSMVEEWMLYANVAAAKKIYEHFPSHALLRRHQAPAERACDDLNKALAARGLPTLDTSTSKALNTSLERCRDLKDPFLNRLVRILTTRCLKQAQYFCSGDLPFEEFLHYGLAMPIYTHFTSPIRRYADVIVHRQLAALTGFGDFSVEKTTSERIAAIAVNINYRHEMAQKAGRDSQNLFTGFFLRKYGDAGIPVEEGYVVRITDTHIAVMVPNIGQEGRVPIDAVTGHYCVLDKVRVRMSLVKEGDVLSAKLAFRLEEPEVATLDAEAKRHRAEEAERDD